MVWGRHRKFMNVGLTCLKTPPGVGQPKSLEGFSNRLLPWIGRGVARQPRHQSGSYHQQSCSACCSQGGVINDVALDIDRHALGFVYTLVVNKEAIFGLGVAEIGSEGMIVLNDLLEDLMHYDFRCRHGWLLAVALQWMYIHVLGRTLKIMERGSDFFEKSHLYIATVELEEPISQCGTRAEQGFHTGELS